MSYNRLVIHTGSRPLEITRAILAASLDRGVADGIFPGGVAACRSDAGLVIAARGSLSWPQGGVPAVGVVEGTVYDLASLTKIIGTLPLVLLSVQLGRLGLEDRVDRFLPELSRGVGRHWNGSISIRSLLAHTSGLPAWRPYFIRLRGTAAYLAAIADEEPSYVPGAAVAYSDLGFMMLGWIVERVWDESLEALARRLVFLPLGMNETAYGTSAPPGLVAPTETGNVYERGMALAYAEGRPVVGGHGSSFALAVADVERFAWRTDTILGAVHDSNAWYGLGGISGHAGLFSTIGDLIRYLAFWDDDGPLDPEIRAAAFARQTPRGSIARGLGWIVPDDGGATHTGFTGTSLRYDPRSGEATIALTNRVHPRVVDGIAAWRTALAADLLAAR